jgi:hypothetical protein
MSSLDKLIKIILLFFFNISFCFAGGSKIIIDQSTIYKNKTIDLTNQSYYITNNATLDIENCIIKGVISPDNPGLFDLSSGKLIFKKNTVNIKTNNIIPDTNNITPFHVFTIENGSIDISGNHFVIDQPFVVSVLTTAFNPTSDFVITDNYFNKFHGGIFLDSTQNALISNNDFIDVSGANIFINESTGSHIKKNTILFSGRNNVGDAIDVLGSINTDIRQNYIANGSCYSILVFNCKDMNISFNEVVGGITYAIYVATSFSNSYNDKYLYSLYHASKHHQNTGNFSIIVTHNYLSQNRFGLAVSDTTGLTVINNYFIQHFSDAESRRFWTDNNNLIINTSQIIWKNNFYKEAYSQVNSDDNIQSKKLVLFPKYGGVVLS